MQMWNLSFGFFGVQIAYALQSANISRIFATLGADPHTLSYFWILPPLMGMLVQPVVGVMSDKTWCRLGRRKPYLYLGALVAVAVMAFLPNSGSLGSTIKAAMAFGLVMLMLLDTSINMAMQPFKMMVGDMVNERQKSTAYAIQSLLCNAGSLVGYLFPYIFTWIGISNVAPEGMIPDSVIYSFYIGAAILILCVLYTGMTVREMPPEEFAKFHNIDTQQKRERKSLAHLIVHAPKIFWQIGLVQFFSWFAFLYMWNYTTGGIAENVWGTTDLRAYVESDAAAYPAPAMRLMFTSNHDENSWSGSEFERMGDAAATFAALTFVLPQGQPLIYTGQEIGLDRRLEFFEKDTVDGLTDPQCGAGWRELYTDLCRLRHTNAALSAGEDIAPMVYMEGAPEDVMAFTREKDGRAVFCLFNLSAEPQTVVVTDSVAGGYKTLTGGEYALTADSSILLAPWQWMILTR